MSAKYNALDIANYILWYANKEHSKIKDVSNLKLQKLLYYVAATYLAKYEEPLFDEPIEKWQLGPVVPSVYREFKNAGRHISQPSFRVKVGSNFQVQVINFDHSKIVEPVTTHIAEIVSNLIKLEPFKLVDKTHAETMWSNDRHKIFSGIKGIKYDNDELKRYFKVNQLIN